jgi:hypothetical protein
MPNTLSKPKPIEEKPTSNLLHEEPLLYPHVYPADYSRNQQTPIHSLNRN